MKETFCTETFDIEAKLKLRLVKTVKVGMIKCCFGRYSLRRVVLEHFLQIRENILFKRECVKNSRKWG